MSDTNQVDPALQTRAVNAIRALVVDAVAASGDGHPGMPLGTAAMGYTLFTQAMRYNPRNAKWPNRDRYVQSAGHGSMLQYALLHLTGFDLSMDELRAYRQWGSKTFAQDVLGRDDPIGEVDEDKLNVLGGSLAYGHPFAATGGRMIVQTLNELRRRGGGLALVTACAAGGLGAAMVLEVA